GARAEQLEDAPGPGAEVHEERKGPPPQRLVHGVLNVLLGDMERADFVPLGGMGLEIGLCRLRARLLHGGGAGTVARESQVGRIETCDDRRRERALGAAFSEAEENPRALAEAGDEAGFGQELQVPADARLALTKNLREVLDVQLGRGKQRQDAQTGGLTRGAKRGKALRAGQALKLRLGAVAIRHKDMFI